MFTRAQAALAVVLAVVLTTILTSSLSVRAQDKPAPGAAPAANVAAADAATGGATGTWTWSFQGPGGNDVTTTLKLKQDGDKLTGTITGFGGQENEIQDGTIKDGQVTFKVIRDFGGNKATTTYTATLSGGSLKGKSETVLTREFDAKRAEK
jgi:hypothetical protein